MEAVRSYNDITETPDKSVFVSLFRGQIINLSVRSSGIRFSRNDLNPEHGTTSVPVCWLYLAIHLVGLNVSFLGFNKILKMSSLPEYPDFRPALLVDAALIELVSQRWKRLTSRNYNCDKVEINYLGGRGREREGEGKGAKFHYLLYHPGFNHSLRSLRERQI